MLDITNKVRILFGSSLANISVKGGFLREPGPFMGPMLQILNTMARCSILEKSPRVPGAFVMHAAAKRAPKNLTIMTSWREEPMPAGMMKMVKQIMLANSTGFLPNISENGAAN